MKAIIDTDIGSDVDDLIALKWFELMPNTELKAVTTVHGDTKLKARIVAKSLDDKTIPIAYGAEKPLVKRKIWLFGHEGKGILDGKENFDLESNATDLLYRTIVENKNDISLLCIGSLTNIALLLKEKPHVQNYIKKFYFMGSVNEHDGKYLPSIEGHNVNVDPEAADILFSSSVPKTIITTEVSKKVILYKSDFEKIRKLNSNWSEYIHKNAQHFIKTLVDRDYCYMYDPLTVMSFVYPDLIKTKTLGNVSVAIEVDAKRVKKILLNTLGVAYDA